MFETLKYVSSYCLHVFICVVDKMFCRSSLKDSELISYSPSIKFHRVCFCQVMFLIPLELIYEGQIDHCILQRYFENVRSMGVGLEEFFKKVPT